MKTIIVLGIFAILSCRVHAGNELSYQKIDTSGPYKAKTFGYPHVTGKKPKTLKSVTIGSKGALWLSARCLGCIGSEKSTKRVVDAFCRANAGNFTFDSLRFSWKLLVNKPEIKKVYRMGNSSSGATVFVEPWEEAIFHSVKCEYYNLNEKNKWLTSLIGPMYNGHFVDACIGGSQAECTYLHSKKIGDSMCKDFGLTTAKFVETKKYGISNHAVWRQGNTWGLAGNRQLRLQRVVCRGYVREQMCREHNVVC